MNVKMTGDKLRWKTKDREGRRGFLLEDKATGKLYLECHVELGEELDLSTRSEESLLRVLQKRYDKRHEKEGKSNE